MLSSNGVGIDKSGMISGISGKFSFISDNVGRLGSVGVESEHEKSNGNESAIKVNLFICNYLIKMV